MSPAERELVLHGWNDTAEPQPVTTVPDLLRSSFSADRGAVAVVDGNVRLTYGELESRVSQLAAHLIVRVSRTTQPSLQHSRNISETFA